MPETTPEREFYIDIGRDEIANYPRVGDTFIQNPGTEDEIKYTVTFVGKESMLVGANEYKELDAVKFTYTIRGKTETYTRTRDQFTREVTGLHEPVKCSRKES